MKVNIDCHLNRVYNHPRDDPMGMPVRDCLDPLTEVERPTTLNMSGNIPQDEVLP